MIVSFTGTQHGMTQIQKERVEEYLRILKPTEFHHGDCVGADAEAHDIAVSLSISIHNHPPKNPDKRAFCINHVSKWYGEKSYLERNKDMARICDVLIAAPIGNQETRRSGTWATVRYARALNKEIIFAYPK